MASPTIPTMYPSAPTMAPLTYAEYVQRGYDEWCAHKRGFYEKLNIMVYMMLGLSALISLCCFLVLLQIYADRKTVRSLPIRILVCVFISNLIYNLAVLPLISVANDELKCGHVNYVEDFENQLPKECYPTAFLVTGLVGTFYFELVMVLVSTVTLRKGSSNISWKTELLFYAVACVLLIAVFIGFIISCRNFYDDSAKEIERSESSNSTDIASRLTFGILRMDFLPETVAVVFAGIALILWIWQRIIYHNILDAISKAESQWHQRDEKAVFSAVGISRCEETQYRLLKEQRKAYAEVARPLEPYVLVTLFFGVPQVILMTKACDEESEQAITGIEETFIPCKYLATFLLMLRPLALVVVYFFDTMAREDSTNITKIFWRAWNRFSGQVRLCFGEKVSASSVARRVRFNKTATIHEIPLLSTGERSFGEADKNVNMMGSRAMFMLTQLDDAEASSST